MLDKDQLIADCKTAIDETDPRGAIQDVVAKAVARPEDLIVALGEPVRAGIDRIYQGPELTIINVTWGPGMTMHPHNHLMWAVIGIYGGREDNTFYRRSDDGLAQHGTEVLEEKDTIPLGESIIHSVTNPLNKITGAIHVYGGDFFETPRSEWDPESKEEHPYDIEHTLRVFEESNRSIS